MKQIPMREFFKNKDNYNYILSPDGKKMLFSKTYKKRVNIWLKDVASGKEEVITTQQKRNIDNYFWKNSNKIIYYQDHNGDENDHLYMVDINTKETIDLTPFKDVKASGHVSLNGEVILKKKQNYKNKIIVTHNNRDKTCFDWYILDIETLESEMIWEGDPQKNIELFDTDTMKPKYISVTQNNGSNKIYSVNDSVEKELLNVSGSDFFYLEEFNDKKDKLYVMSNIGVDKLSLYEIDLDLNINSMKLLYSNPNVDLQGVAIEPLTRKLLFASYNDTKTNYFFFDKKYEAEKNAIIKAVIDKYDYEKDASFAFSKNYFIKGLDMVTTYSSNKLATEYIIINEEIIKLSTDEVWLNADNLAIMKPISYKARDGLTINGFITLPKGVDGPVPFIVNPHGGPWVRDTWGYISEVQYLANRGYGVFQPNFRISTGYGKDFFTKGWKQWGLSCQDDITDGTNWLIDQGYATKGKIGIYGGSYGGYTTLMGIVKEPDLYSAAIDYVGVSDLFSFWDGLPPYWRSKGSILELGLGNPHENEEYAKKVSPLYHVDKIKTPLMIVQGGKDPRVPQKQADLIYNKLKERNVDVEYILKADEGHGFSNEENKFEFYEKMILFLDKHLK